MKNRQSRIFANREIRYSEIRLVTESGSNVLATNAALKQAEQAGLDLVLINEQSSPPICKILELNKYKYELKIKEKEAAKAQRAAQQSIKEVQFKLNIDNHDFSTKCRHIDKFINNGAKVKVQIQFKGRERQHTQLGFDIIDRVLSEVENIELDGKPQFSGNRITAIIKGTKDVKTVSQSKD